MFHRLGVKGVGVDAITEAAGTNKMTLYRHFGSKDELITECMKRAAQDTRTFWTGLEETHAGNPEARLDAWIQAFAAHLQSDSQGCEMIKTTLELTEDDHPARRVIEEAKRDSRNRLAEICRDAGLSSPELVADTLMILAEGARVSRRSVGATGPSACFEHMARELVGAHQRRPAD